jgi:hypothetical protein
MRGLTVTLSRSFIAYNAVTIGDEVLNQILSLLGRTHARYSKTVRRATYIPYLLARRRAGIMGDASVLAVGDDEGGLLWPASVS